MSYPDDKEIESWAKDAYEVYSEAVGGVNFQGDALPGWEEYRNDPTKTKTLQGWLAVGKFVIEHR